jgi:HEAT repeat protein
MTETNLLQRYMRLATSEDPDERAESARELKVFLENSAASALLLVMLGDIDWRVRKAAVESFVDAHVPRTIPDVLMALYDDENAGRRNAAIDILIHFRDDIIPYLEPHLKSRSADVRMFLINILGEIRNDSLLDFILTSLDDKEGNLVSAAIITLGKLGNPETSSRLQPFLRGRDAWLKFQAIEATGEMQDPSLIPDLIESASDHYFHNAALKALSRFHHAQAYNALVTSLVNKNGIDVVALQALIDLYDSPAPTSIKERERKAIADELTSKLQKTHLEILEKGIQENDGLIKKNLIRIVGLAGGCSAVPIFVEALNQPELSEVAAQSLVLCDRESAKPLLERLKHDLEEDELLLYLGILNELSFQPSIDQIVPYLEHPSSEIRYQAFRLLSRTKSQKVTPLWMTAAMDLHPPIQEIGVGRLLEICKRTPTSGDEIKWAMREKLHSGNATERANALQFLIRYEGEPSLPFLFQALKDENALVRKKAVSLMSTGYLHEFQKFLIGALADEDSGVRETAAKALSAYSAPEVVEALLASVSDDVLWVRIAVFESLAALHVENAETLFEKQFEKENPIGQTALLKALGHFRSARSRELLLKALNSEDPEIRLTACESLGIFNESEIVFRLFTLMQNDPEWSVRAAAIRALTEIRPFRLQEALLERLKADNDHFVKKEILHSLQKLGLDYLPSGICELLLDKDLADPAYEFLTTSRERFLKQLQEASRTQSPAIRRILKEIIG